MDYDKDFEDFWQAYRPPPTGLAYDGQRSAKEWIPIRLLHEPIRGLLRQGMESHMKTNQPRSDARLLLWRRFLVFVSFVIRIFVILITEIGRGAHVIYLLIIHFANQTDGKTFVATTNVVADNVR